MKKLFVVWYRDSVIIGSRDLVQRATRAQDHRDFNERRFWARNSGVIPLECLRDYTRLDPTYLFGCIARDGVVTIMQDDTGEEYAVHTPLDCASKDDAPHIVAQRQADAWRKAGYTHAVRDIPAGMECGTYAAFHQAASAWNPVKWEYPQPRPVCSRPGWLTWEMYDLRGRDLTLAMCGFDPSTH
jgi:hypothetical protein